MAEALFLGQLIGQLIEPQGAHGNRRKGLLAQHLSAVRCELWLWTNTQPRIVKAACSTTLFMFPREWHPNLLVLQRTAKPRQDMVWPEVPVSYPFNQHSSVPLKNWKDPILSQSEEVG